jgi:hypothetical protein
LASVRSKLYSEEVLRKRREEAVVRAQAEAAERARKDAAEIALRQAEQEKIRKEEEAKRTKMEEQKRAHEDVVQSLRNTEDKLNAAEEASAALGQRLEDLRAAHEIEVNTLADAAEGDQVRPFLISFVVFVLLS